MHAKILECADNLQAGAVTYMRQAGIAMSAEVPLVDETVFGPVEYSTPFFQLICCQFCPGLLFRLWDRSALQRQLHLDSLKVFELNSAHRILW
jgi:hypothetical protein